MTAAALELHGVAKSYGAVQSLVPTSLTVRQGEFLTLLGPSGSGKTTLLGIAAGIIHPDAGRVIAEGRDVTGRPIQDRNIGMVFQRYALFPNKTVAENIAFPLRVRRMDAQTVRAKVDEALALVGLARHGDRYPAQISGGEAQRVALARALVFQPGLLLMDEPLGALDRRLRQELQEEIRRIQRATGVPTLYVTHDQEEAMSLSDRIVILRDGAVVAEGVPKVLYREPASLWAARFLGDANACPVTAMEPAQGGWRATTRFGRAVMVSHPAPPGCATPHLVLRPEDIAVHTEDLLGAWSGLVEDAVFLGGSCQLRILLDGGWLVHAVQHGRITIEAGQRVHCDWPAYAPRIVPGG